MNSEGGSRRLSAHAAKAVLLSRLEPFAVGAKRRCFVHPDDPDLCIKVPLSADDGIAHVEQRRDVENYTLLKHRGLEAALDRIPAIKGVAETDLGAGVVSELCRDADGRISANLGKLVWTHGLTPALAEAVGELKTWLRDQRLLIRDTGPHNIVAVRRGPDEWKLMIVEGWMYRRHYWLVRQNRFLADCWIDRQLRRFDRRAARLTNAG